MGADAALGGVARLKRSTTREVAVGGAAAVSAGVGLCAAFCSLGCNV